MKSYQVWRACMTQDQNLEYLVGSPLIGQGFDIPLPTAPAFDEDGMFLTIAWSVNWMQARS